MKKILFTLLIVYISNTYAQYAPNKHTFEGSISGEVIDNNQNPVEFATISIISKNNNKIVNGGITNEKGQFLIDKIKPGIYNIDISFIGFKSKKINNIKINRTNTNVNLGKISITEDSQTLSEVEVVAEKEIMQNKIDKKVFNVSKSIAGETSSLLEMLEKIPSIDIDQDNNISLRGNSNIRILIDGRPASLMGNDISAILEQFPANAVESIEIITNPSAKYDAEGMAGIINIKLKKSNKKNGTNGSVLISAGTSQKYNASLRINHRQGKFNFFASYSYRYNKRDFIKNAFRTNLLTDTSFYLKQDNAGNRYLNSHMVNAGVDFDINKKNVISYNFNYNTGLRDYDEDMEYRYINENEYLENITLRQANGDSKRSSFDNSILFTSQLANKGEELSGNITLAHSYSDKNNDYEENYFTANMNPIPDTIFIQNDYSYFENTNYYGQMDYVRPFNNNMKLETGVKANYETQQNKYNLNNFIDNSFVEDTALSSDFIYNRAIYAAYASLTGKLQKLSWQTGLRYEYTETSFDIKNDKNNYKNTINNLFPTVHLTYELQKMSDVSISYSRRINRPGMRSLNPIPNYSDPANIKIGNPYLNPEFINSFELGYSKRIKRISIVSSIYYRYITDIIKRYKKVDDYGNSIVTYTNLDNGQNYGLELIIDAGFLKTFRANASVNMYKTIINGDNNTESDLSNDSYGMSSRIMISGKLPKKFSIQISGMYRSPITIPQGYIEPMYWADFSIKKKILKDKGSISLRLSDIFNTRDFDIAIDDVNFEQTMHYKTTSRILFVSFTYNFGKQFAQNKRRNKERNKNQRDADDDIGL
jgi:outer membrane receptor protein involved in Fe transport